MGLLYEISHVGACDLKRVNKLFIFVVHKCPPLFCWRHFQMHFLNGSVWISIKISLKFAPKGRINNIAALVRIMAWRWPGDKPLSEPMMVSLLTHICVTRPQLVNGQWGIIARLSNRCYCCMIFAVKFHKTSISVSNMIALWPITN